MIHFMSQVEIVDNSGAKKGRCIKILTPKGQNYGQSGDLILVSVLDAYQTTSQIKSGDVYKALIIRTKIENRSPFSLKSDQQLQGQKNSVILVKVSPKTGEYTPIGTRIKGPISAILLKKKNCQKILSLAKFIL